MKSKSIASVIVLMSIAFIALVATQLYMLDLALNAQRSSFIVRVDRAMDRVIKVIDIKGLIVSYDEGRKVGDFSDRMQSRYDSLRFGHLGEEYYKNDLELGEYKTQLLSFVVESGCNYDYLSLGFDFIDSVVFDKLHRVGIDIPYELGIYDPTNKVFLYQSTGNYTDELKRSAGRYNLLSMDKEKGTRIDHLVIYFPYLNKFLNSKSLWFFMFSIAILGLVLFCFIYTISIIRKQKTLAEMKNDFVHNMTHELKTPIATIGLACETLRDKDIQRTEGLVDSYLGIISEENQRLKGMVEEVLEAARFEKGYVSAKLTELDVHVLLKECVQSMQLPIEEKKASVKLDFEAEESFVYGDQMHLMNAFSNLLDNALKYCDKHPEIVIKTRDLHNDIEIRFQDNGPGISSANQKKIFDNFYRVGTGNLHDVKGHGLGLSYVKNVMELNRGSVKVESELHHGAVFVLTLPLVKNHN